MITHTIKIYQSMRILPVEFQVSLPYRLMPGDVITKELFAGAFNSNLDHAYQDNLRKRWENYIETVDRFTVSRFEIGARGAMDVVVNSNFYITFEF